MVRSNLVGETKSLASVVFLDLIASPRHLYDRLVQRTAVVTKAPRHVDHEDLPAVLASRVPCVKSNRLKCPNTDGGVWEPHPYSLSLGDTQQANRGTMKQIVSVSGFKGSRRGPGALTVDGRQSLGAPTNNLLLPAARRPLAPAGKWSGVDVLSQRQCTGRFMGQVWTGGKQGLVRRAFYAIKTPQERSEGYGSI